MSENVEEKLKTLKGTLQTTEEEIEKKTKEKSTLKGDIANLERIVKEINLISDAYKKGFTSIQENETEIDNYIKLKESMLENAVKDKKDKIISKIKEFDDSIDEIEVDVEDLQEAFEKAQEAYEDAKEVRDKSQIKYNSFKTKQKDIEDKQKKLKDYKQSIEKEEDSKNTTNMYFFIQESKKILDETKTDILSEENFKQKLLEVWNELNADEMSVRDKESKLGEAKKKYDEKQKALDTARKDRNQHILEKLKTI